MRPRLLLTSLILVALLAPPAIALAASRFYRGPVGTGANNATMEITAQLSKSKPHRPTKLTRIEYANVPLSCGRFGRGATSDFYPKDVPVSGGSFSSSAKLNGGRVTVTLSGTFHSHPMSITGKIHIKGTVPGCATGDSGALSYKVKPPA
jgi:hypothetical protein